MKIISGGQTGVDRAALDVARALGLDYGGFIPQGRKAEDGPIDAAYDRLIELDTDIYARRTEKNVMNSDATLIITANRPAGGTAYTIECARELGKPYFIANLAGKPQPKVIAAIERWLGKTKPEILNIAGPRESKVPGVYQKAYAVLHVVLGR